MALFKRKKKPVYEDPYAAQLQEQANKVLSRPAFSYDPGKDPMYSALKDQAVKNGRMAMLDTQAQAANLTGGYGSTYGQQAGQQAYQAYLQDLNDLLPELQTAARAAYDSETDKLLTQYQLTAQAADRDYSRYQDELAAYWQESALDRQEALDENNLKQQNRNNLLSLLQAGYTPTQEELDAAGLTQAQASALLPKVSTGGGGGSGAGGTGPSYTLLTKVESMWKKGYYKTPEELLAAAKQTYPSYAESDIAAAIKKLGYGDPYTKGFGAHAKSIQELNDLVVSITRNEGSQAAETYVRQGIAKGEIAKRWRDFLIKAIEAEEAVSQGTISQLTHTDWRIREE